MVNRSPKSYWLSLTQLSPATTSIFDPLYIVKTKIVLNLEVLVLEKAFRLLSIAVTETLWWRSLGKITYSPGLDITECWETSCSPSFNDNCFVTFQFIIKSDGCSKTTISVAYNVLSMCHSTFCGLVYCKKWYLGTLVASAVFWSMLETKSKTLPRNQETKDLVNKSSSLIC